MNFELDSEENQKAQEILRQGGFTIVDLEDITNDPVRYAKILADGKKANKYGHLVWYHTPEELSDGRMLFATNDNGICISVCPDGDICSLVRNPFIAPERKGIIPTVITKILAVKTNDHKNMECYGEVTARAYEKMGFRAIAYYTWSKEDQQSDWPDWDSSRPNMYFLIHNGDSASEVARKYGTYNYSTDEELRALPNFGPRDCPEIYEYSRLIRAGRINEAQRVYENKKKELE